MNWLTEVAKNQKYIIRPAFQHPWPRRSILARPEGTGPQLILLQLTIHILQSARRVSQSELDQLRRLWHARMSWILVHQDFDEAWAEQRLRHTSTSLHPAFLYTMIFKYECILKVKQGEETGAFLV